MKRPPLLVGITSLPSRIELIRPTLESLLAGNTRPDRILLALPDQSRREQSGYEIPTFLGEEPFRSIVQIMRPTKDWGPGTKLLGSLPAIHEPSVLVIADDDVRYRHDFLANLYHAQIDDHSASFSHYVYRTHGLDVGQGCDGFSFWTSNLKGVEAFAERYVWDTRLMLHDDLWLSFFLAGRNIPVRSLANKLGQGLIYEEVYEINALRTLTGQDSREALTRKSMRRLILNAPMPPRRRLRIAAATALQELRHLVRGFRERWRVRS